MPNEYSGNSRIEIEHSNSDGTDGGYIIDPDTIGTNQGTIVGNGDTPSGDTGSTYADGYGEAGQFGKGRFPDGRSRKRSERGTARSETSGEASVGETRKARTPRIVNASGIEHLLIAIHYGISVAVERGYEEKIIPLQPEQAKVFAKAIADVSKYYPQMQSSGKIADHLVLIGTAASIYVPMGYFLYSRYKDEKENKNKPKQTSQQTASIFDFVTTGK